MILRIRENKFFKTTVFLLIVQLLTESLGLNYVLAGDGGPTQPEVHSFEPMGTTQMVDPFTGDFTYNIPLFNLPGPNGGYPVNLAYHSGVQMDQEASWVGLGWNINMGTISRQVRNLPDDFSKDVVKIKTDEKPNWTIRTGLKGRFEFVGIDPQEAAPTISAGIDYYYNNYRGFGYSTDFGLSLKLRKVNEHDEGSKVAGDLGFNVKLDSREGVSGNIILGASLMDGVCSSTTKKSISVSTGFDRNGWQRSINIQGLADVKRAIKKKNPEGVSAGVTGGNSLSFTQPLVPVTTPQSMKGGSGSVNFGFGFNTPGVLTKMSFSTSFELSKLKNKNKEVNYYGIGYLYFQNQGSEEPEDERRVKDISTENDGLVHKDTRRLAIPTLTYDNYSVTGQGIGNSFRPHRTDIGNAETPYVHSEFHGGDLGVEVAIPNGTIRLGIDIGYSFSGSTVKPWPTGTTATAFSYTDASLIPSAYYKVYGDHAHDDLTANYGARIASNEPLAYAINEEDNFYNVQNLDQQGNAIITNNVRATRRKRAEDIEPFTNKAIMDGNYSASLIPEFALKYYNSSSWAGYNKLEDSYFQNYDGLRSTLPAHHIGGYIATNSDGLKYVYGLPAQSKKERDVTFSVAENTGMLNQTTTVADPSNYKLEGTNKYYNSVEKGTYAHSYMLTSILGEDYVDLDNEKGASDGDLGYWVKFNYYKAYDNFKWKSPYKDVNYSKGYKTNFKDGTANYSYGEKEVWYVATVETKTHVAEFILMDRDDCKEPSGEVNNTTGSNSYKKLDKINIYLKSERYANGSFNGSAKPIQTCHFQYFSNTTSLCKGSPDNTNSNGGKLTLEKVWFTYRNNASAATNPYVFEYNKTVGGTEITYDKFSVDKWGNYKPFTNADNPYVDPYVSKSVMDERAGLWNLKAINLPSGGRYEIDYESDTYAYVQNEVAMQMFKISSMSPYNESIDGLINSGQNGDAASRRVYFKLEKPIPVTTSQQQKEQMRKYIREGEYLYFKVNINLTKSNDSKETVGGYSRVGDIDVDATSVSGGNYLWGYVELEPLKVNGESTEYHPFTEVGARHIRYNQPEILVDNLPNADMDDLNKGTAISIATSMVSTIATIGSKFKKYTKSLYKDGDARLSGIDLDNSYLRMRTPDKVKFGGGHRVKEVRIYDNWAISTASGEASSYYGTVYEYDITDANGNTISSGVATYEPLVGGDENPMRNPVRGWEDKNVLAKNVANTYTEDPGNESIYPGASVGYSQVRILSKNTADKKSNFSGSAIQHYGGVTVQEFFTAKDFPIINKVTELQQNKTFRKSRLIVPAIFANVDRLRMAATQGYYTELNDMHGKVKGGKELALVVADNSNGYEEQVISSVEYDYFDEEKLTTNRAGETFITRTLKNEVDILFTDNDPNLSNLGNAKILPGTLATDIEFVPRTQYVNKKNISGSINLNFEFITPIPLFYPIPYFNWQEEKVGTVVTNKVVNKSGLLSKITAIQEGSKVETQNLVFDDLTGAPLLTTVTNDYGDKIYNYSILARDIYNRTGASYQNIGKSAYLTTPQTLTNGIQEITLQTPANGVIFVKGDRLMLIPVVPDLPGSSVYIEDTGRPKLLARYADQSGNNLQLEVSQAMTGTFYQAVIIQSGRKNNLTTPVSSIIALSDPTKNREVITCANNTPGLPDLMTFQMRKIDNVIGISASELGEYWYKDTRQITGTPSTWYNNAFYSKGFGGNFNPIRNYAYIADRTQSANVNLKLDGVMNDVPLFNFESILVQPSSNECKSNWRMTDQITLMNPSSNAIESKNTLNTFSASLYGRNGIEPIAVAGNAKTAEIGFESFEEYTTTAIDIDANSTNNLNFYSTNTNSGATVRMENRFDMRGTGGYGSITAPASFSASDYNSYVVRIHFDAFIEASSGTFFPKEERLVRLNASDLTITGTSISFTQTNNLFNIPEQFRRAWRGEIFLGKTVPNPGPSGGANLIQLFNGKGHTGDKSLKVSNSTGAIFLQRRLNLTEGKEYQFSGWFSTENNLSLQTLHNSTEYFMQPFKVEFMDASNAVLSSVTYKEADILQGTFIDEWQKFTLNFTMPAGAKYVRFTLPLAKEVNVGNGEFVQYSLFDDLRVQPRDAGMSTYVYNNENQRLEAELDENNYATFYYYNGEGQLFLVKRETEKGIITVQESRTSLKRE